MSVGRFYAGIAALVRRSSDDKYLLLKRSEDKDFGGGVWECVTGRVDQEEGFEEALHREVREEIGVAVDIEFVVGTSHFYRGVAKPENELVGITYCCALDDADAVRISEEHSEYCWTRAEEARQLLVADDPGTRWIGRVIDRAEIIRAQLPGELTQFFRDNGFALD